MFDSSAVSSANRSNNNAGSDAGVAQRCSATAQQSRVEGAWFGRDDPSKHLVELCEHIILTNALQRPPASGKLSTRFDPSTRGLTDDHENDL
jgi:hypothetical protein